MLDPDEFRLQLLVRLPMFLEAGYEPDLAKIAALAREIRELAQERLGHEIVVDVFAPAPGRSDAGA